MCWETVVQECATCLSGAVKITTPIRHVRTQGEFIISWTPATNAEFGGLRHYQD